MRPEPKDSFFGPHHPKPSERFYVLSLMSIFALVHIWRFPHVTVQNGGGAFLYVYLFLASTLGSCFVMAELLIGKMTASESRRSLSQWARERWNPNQDLPWVLKVFYKSLLNIHEVSGLLSLLVTAYITLIGAWFLSYLGYSLISQIWPQWLAPSAVETADDSFLKQMAFALIHLSLAYFLVRKGVRTYFTKIAQSAMVIFGFSLIYLCYQALNLPGAVDAVRFLLYPDFTQVNFATLNQAFGHLFLSLGLGYGILISVGGTFQKEREVSSSGSKLMTLSLVTSGFSVLIICPLVLGAPLAVFGPKLLFQTLPQWILKSPEGPLVLGFFYGSLYVLSLVSTVGVLESLVTRLSERRRLEPSKVLVWSLLITALLLLFPLLSSTLWRHFRWLGGVSLLETADGLLVNYFLPLMALGTALTALWLIPMKAVKEEFIGSDGDPDISQFFPIWRVIILWFSPILIGLAFLLRLLA